MVSISVTGCCFKPVQASPVPGQGEDEEGSCEPEFMDNSCDGESAIKQANSEEVWAVVAKKFTLMSQERLLL